MKYKAIETNLKRISENAWEGEISGLKAHVTYESPKLIVRVSALPDGDPFKAPGECHENAIGKNASYGEIMCCIAGMMQYSDLIK